jgi:hypothetical protein
MANQPIPVDGLATSYAIASPVTQILLNRYHERGTNEYRLANIAQKRREWMNYWMFRSDPPPSQT